MHEKVNELSIGEKIKKNRKIRDMTQSQLSTALGISRQTLSKWENNKTFPDMEKLLVLCDVFDFTLDEFLADIPGSEIEMIKYMRKKDELQRKLIIILIGLLFIIMSGISYYYVKNEQCKQSEAYIGFSEAAYQRAVFFLI